MQGEWDSGKPSHLQWEWTIILLDWMLCLWRWRCLRILSRAWRGVRASQRTWRCSTSSLFSPPFVQQQSSPFSVRTGTRSGRFCAAIKLLTFLWDCALPCYYHPADSDLLRSPELFASSRGQCRDAGPGLSSDANTVRSFEGGREGALHLSGNR